MDKKLKNIKVTEDSWRAVKVFAAMNNVNIRVFVEEAIQEKLQRESPKTKAEPKEKEDFRKEGPEENEFEALRIELSRIMQTT